MTANTDMLEKKKLQGLKIETSRSKYLDVPLFKSMELLGVE